MKKWLLLLLGALALPSSGSSVAYVVPVATARVQDRVYSTTLAFRNESRADIRCEAAYAVPNDPKGGTLRALYDVPAGETVVEVDTLMEAGAVGTMRLDCSAPITIAVRIQSSEDGGATFHEGRVFPATSEESPLTSGLVTVETATDLLVMEVGGKPATFSVLVKHGQTVVGKKSYELPAFAQQNVNLSRILDEGHPAVDVEITIEPGGGGIVVTKPSADAMLLAMTRRMDRGSREQSAALQAARLAAPEVDRKPSVTRMLLLSPFKAAPFVEPATGLVYMRDRWYDPSTGTFLTPDPEGNADSSNLYAYCGGDPVNCSDPTGRLGDGGDLRHDFRVKEQAEAARRHAIWCAQHPVDCKKLEVRGRGIMRMVGGVGQTAAGTGAVLSTGPIPEPVTKGFGGTAIVRGIDNALTGAVETWTGTARDTVTGRAFYLLLLKGGMSPAQASKITGWTEVGVDLASTLGASLVPPVNTALRLRPVGGVVNIGGTGEIANVSNLNPVLAHTGGRATGIPNHAPAYGEQIAEVFAPDSAREIISRRLPFNTVEWQRLARGTHTVLQPQGGLELNIYVSGLSRVEESAFQANLIREFTRAGFRNVRVEGSGPGTMLLGTK